MREEPGAAVVDTHCHLTFPDFAGRVDAVLEEAASAGVSDVITISTTTWDCVEALGVAREQREKRAGEGGREKARVWCTAGVHPLYSDAADERAVSRGRGGEGGGEGVGEARAGHTWENLRRVAREELCVAWGEIGLDRHYSQPGWEVQERVLEEQLDWIESWNHDGEGGIGKAGGMPMVIHCREAFRELLPRLRARKGLRGDRFVFHCFTGGAAEMRAVLDFGAYVSFTGVLTYGNAGDVREAARMAPRERMMVETDAPFLSPGRHRGKRPCVPAWVVETAKVLAEVRGERYEELHGVLNENTKRFFGVGK